MIKNYIDSGIEINSYHDLALESNRGVISFIRKWSEIEKEQDNRLLKSVKIMQLSINVR
jgi:hypothetical protein